MDNICWTIFEIAIDFLESYLVIWFLSKVQGFKKNREYMFLPAVAIFFCELIVINSSVSFEGLAIFFPILTLYLYAQFFLNGSVLEKLFVSFLTIVCIIIINSTVAILANVIFKVTLKDLIFNKNIFRFIIVLLTKAIFFIIAKSIIRLKKLYHHYELNSSEWILLLFSPIISIFFCTQIMQSVLLSGVPNDKLYNFLFFTICIILVNILNYYLFLKITASRKAKNELDFLKYQLYYQQKSIKNLNETYSKLQVLRHDMQNNIFCVLALLEQQAYDEAQNYLTELSGEINNTQSFMKTNNKAIDCILSLKIQSAKEQNIDFTCDIEQNIKTKNDIDICILLANLLDNAIESCQKICTDKKSIHLEIKCDNFISILVKNSIENSVLENNPTLNSSKKDSVLHGFGTLSVKSIVKKYNGYLNYYEHDGNFCCKTMLPQI